MPTKQRLLACWAKLGFGHGLPEYHPLLYHMVDVSIVAREMWRSAFSPAQRTVMSEALGLGGHLEAVGLWCAFLAGLHDLGKASPAFQLQVDNIRGKVTERLHRSHMRVPVQHRLGLKATPHGTITAATLPDILTSEFDIPKSLAMQLGTVAGGHHGTFPTSRQVQDVNSHDTGGPEWAALRRDLVNTLAEFLDVPRDRTPVEIANGAAMVLAGFISVADWIGSNTDFFPPTDTSDLAAYALDTQQQGRRALEGLGWLLQPFPQGRQGFAGLFPGIPDPNDLQLKVEKLAPKLNGPSLVIIEAPMGEGKTEAAMYLADHWAENTGRQGCYFALPTQATSNQMFGRVRDFLGARYPGDLVQLQLLHGHAALSSEFEVLRENGDRLFSPQYAGVEPGGNQLGVIAAEWFTSRKRGLLAPFGVGTIDQVLLAVLQTRHVFVRLFGLSGKTIIIDEVHAYDAYMTTLLERLLEWLAALGSPVVLLSATLPKSRRAALMNAYWKGLGQEGSPQNEGVDYPRLSWASRDPGPAAQSVGVSPRSEKRIRLEVLDGSLPAQAEDAFGLGDVLKETLAHGGCAAVICNTVRRAQEVYNALKPCFPGTADDGGPELDLLHSQYLFRDREEREKRTLARFGKPGDVTVRRPARAILVATQVIEQSLDLDFDLMVSDMAPADLLLQRAGRLHRHRRSGRPPGLESPRLLVCRPEIYDGVPCFDPGTAAVYDRHVLLRSWMALGHRETLRVPDDVEAIIEDVYDENVRPDDLPGPLRENWEETRKILEAARAEEMEEARDRWIRSPSYRGPLWRLTENTREEDAPDFHRAHQALTRLASPSAQVVFLFGSGDRAWLDPAHHEPVDLSRAPSIETTKRLLRRSVNLSDRRVVFELLRQAAPSAWRGSALMRHHKAVLLNDGGTAETGSYELSLDAETGVRVSNRV